VQKYMIFACVWLVGCSNLMPYIGTRKRLKEFTVNDLQIYLITNRDQFPVEPRNPSTVGMWVLRYGMAEEIWVCAYVNGDVWTPEPGILEHELLHALHHRDAMAIQDPDKRGILGEVILLHEVSR
jgi:hypothetical protein